MWSMQATLAGCAAEGWWGVREIGAWPDGGRRGLGCDAAPFVNA
jgi:hypothetical protein